MSSVIPLPMSSNIDEEITNLLSEVLKVTYLEDAFNCVIVHRQIEEEKYANFQHNLASTLTPLTVEQKEVALRQLLNLLASETNLSQLKKLLNIILNLVNNFLLPARMVCEQILQCDKLTYQKRHFWIECFNFIRRIVSAVDYKGVREIMKLCRDKFQTFPYNINQNILPQITAVEELIEYIFDRNSSLLPAYFIANEIQKLTPLHWKIAKLTADYVEEFRKTAQLVSVIGHSAMLPIVEHFGYTESLINPWRLDPNTLKFTSRGILPYDAELTQPQTRLLRFVLEQPYSKDMVCSMLNLQKQHKQRCVAIEEQLVWLVMSAMERSEMESIQSSDTDESSNPTHWLWMHISSQLIYFVLFQFASFPNIVIALHKKLSIRDIRKGRDYLMWALLQFISGSIQRNPLSNFMAVLNLYDILYPEKEPLPVPDCSKPFCTRQMSPTCIWIHLNKKAQSEHVSFNRPIPPSLKLHYEFLQHMMMSNNTPLTMGTDFIIVLMCNAYSTNPEYFTRPMAALVETINKNSSQTSGSSSSSQQIPTIPLSMVTLDCLTVHAKMSLIHNIVSHMIKQAQTKSQPQNITNMAPALVETYSRLLVYTEIESLGIKGFLSQLLPAVFKSHAWGILHTLLEMLSYRMHHIQPFYRVQLLVHLHSLASVPHTNQTQLHLCVESTALRLITGLGSAEVQPQLSRYFAEPKQPGSIVSSESEELNRALILTIARSMHITGTGNDEQSSAWCKDLLSSIMQYTPHSWAYHTLQCFPPILNTFFTHNVISKENKQHLKKSVEEEYRNWVSMSNENDIIAHFSVAGTPPLFLCLLFKMILETDGISAVAYKILERIGARALSAHLRKLCDYLVFEVANSGQNTHINKCVDTINDMIWKYNIVTIDRLVLCLALHTQEGSEAQVCFFIIQLLLLKASEFRSRVQEFVKDNSPDHWKQSNWHEKHLSFHQKYREKFAPEESVLHPSLPVYFGNVCLRFLPVLDIVIHRFLEVPIPSVNKTLEIILDHLGCLYKFHDRPVTYLYNTLHFYEWKLRERPPLKKRLVAAIIGALSEIRPANWVLSESYQAYIEKIDVESCLWVPELSYYIGLMRRFIDTINGKTLFYLSDWRFNEFPNAPAHALYVTCVELLSLPVGPQAVANKLIDVILKGYTVIPVQQIYSWINAIGVLMASLPEAYWSVIYDRLQDTLSNKMVEWKYRYTPFELFNFKTVKEAVLDNSYVLLLGVAQSILHHSSIGQIATLADYIKDKLKPFVQSEPQLLYVCSLFGPFMLRLDQERPRVGYDITTLFYEMLEQVDKKQGNLPLLYMDTICDLLYHIKYMFVGDVIKEGTEAIIRRLRPALQMRLRFITHLNVEEIATTNTTLSPVEQNEPNTINNTSNSSSSNVLQVSHHLTAPTLVVTSQPQQLQIGSSNDTNI